LRGEYYNLRFFLDFIFGTSPTFSFPFDLEVIIFLDRLLLSILPANGLADGVDVTTPCVGDNGVVGEISGWYKYASTISTSIHAFYLS
jgi:hypothetical protein